MSIYFLNSQAGIYNDKELNKLPQILFSSGVFNTKAATHALWKTAGDFLVESDSATRNISARPGSASVLVTVNGEAQRALITEDVAMTAEVAQNTTVPLRCDAVVLRVNQAIITNDQLNPERDNAVTLLVLSGNSATPLTDAEIAVALANDPFVRLADINIPLGASAITPSMVVDRRSMVKMSRQVKPASDSFQFYALAADPENPDKGQVWYNDTEGILKMFNGVSTVALQAQSFDWGYYGKFDNLDTFDAIDENVSSQNLGGLLVNSWWKPDESFENTFMAMQLLEMPPVANPFVRLKMGNPEHQAGIIVRTYTIDGSNNPVALVEQLANIAESDVPRNGYIDFSMNGSLYTTGVKYAVIVSAANHIFSGSIVNGKTGQVQVSKNTETLYFKGTRHGWVSSLTSNPVSLSWGGIDLDSQFVMSIYEKDEITIGHTDITGQVNQLIQPFTARSKDIVSFNVIKGLDAGSPTGDINLRLYNADLSGKPVGSVLAQGSVTNTFWESFNPGDTIALPLFHDELVVGSRYAVVIDCDIESDTDNYTMYFGITQGGTALRHNTADGYVPLGGELYFGYSVSSVNKIVVTGDDGLVPPELIKRRVQYIDYAASPEYDASIETLIVILAATGNINLTNGLKGTPYDGQEIEFRIVASGATRTVAYGDMFESRWDTMETSIADGYTLRSVFQFDATRGKFGCIESATVAA